MIFAGNFKNVASNMQQGARNVSISAFQRILRLVTGFFIGLVFALILQELTQSETLMLLFFTTLFMVLIYRATRSLSIWKILVIDVFFVLIANTLRMYILLAP